MAFGVNLLFRMGRKLLAEPLEETGLLPGKYYRSQALEALQDNDFPECLRYLKMAQAHRKAQARLTGQLLILRCRMLQEHHQRRIQTLEEMQRLESNPEARQRYQQIQAEEHRALRLLAQYVREAQNILKKPENPATLP
ncbi:MAG: hypothetical protein FJ135_04030 [Deltaproteobacteria bacterium]|nr:hypothetical protein [Deltaproteobacteria bacterium]